MSYTRNIQVGKKVTVTATKRDEYFDGSVVVQEMPAQDITREIYLHKYEFDVILNPIYNNQSVQNYQGWASNGDNNSIKRFEVNGEKKSFLNIQNSVFPQFKYYGNHMYVNVGIPDFNICDAKYDNLSNPTIVKYTSILHNISSPNIYIQNTTPPNVPLTIDIPLYKRILCEIKFKYTDNNNQIQYYNCKRAYCTELDDVPTATRDGQSDIYKASIWLIKGYTYTFEFEINNSIVTRTYLVNPVLDEKVIIQFTN